MGRLIVLKETFKCHIMNKKSRCRLKAKSFISCLKLALTSVLLAMSWIVKRQTLQFNFFENKLF